MRIVRGDLWEYHRRGAWAVIPTNTTVRANGTAVMGAGLAKQAVERFPELAQRYGQALVTRSEREREQPAYFFEERLILFPTKRDWKQPSCLKLVKCNLELLAHHVAGWESSLAVPLLGCGLGGLDWEREVRPLVERYLSGLRYAVVVND